MDCDLSDDTWTVSVIITDKSQSSTFSIPFSAHDKVRLHILYFIIIVYNIGRLTFDISLLSKNGLIFLQNINVTRHILFEF